VTYVYGGDSVGHVWPATFDSLEEENSDGSASFNASSMIMDFFARYRLPTDGGGGGAGSDGNATTTSPASQPTQTEAGASAFDMKGVVPVLYIILICSLML
jgi:hypothetical protein